MLRALGADRGVLVQPSHYATDNSAMIDALVSAGSALRGVAAVADDVSDAELMRMHLAGVRGLRINLRTSNRSVIDIAPAMAARIAPLGWHLQLCIRPREFISLEPILEKLPVAVVVDHIGQVPIEAGVGGSEFQALLRMTQSGRCWIKLSAPMRMSVQDFPYRDVTPFVQALLDLAPHRMLWGTDWPHPNVRQVMPNDGDLADLLSDWVPDAALRKTILVDSPARLYWYE